MESKISIDMFRNESADCSGDSNHSLLIGGVVYEVCACGSGCNDTFNVRKFVADLNEVVGELGELEELETGIDFEGEAH